MTNLFYWVLFIEGGSASAASIFKQQQICKHFDTDWVIEGMSFFPIKSNFIKFNFSLLVFSHFSSTGNSQISLESKVQQRPRIILIANDIELSVAVSSLVGYGYHVTLMCFDKVKNSWFASSIISHIPNFFFPLFCWFHAWACCVY